MVVPSLGYKETRNLGLSLSRAFRTRGWLPGPGQSMEVRPVGQEGRPSAKTCNLKWQACCQPCGTEGGSGLLRAMHTTAQGTAHHLSVNEVIESVLRKEVIRNVLCPTFMFVASVQRTQGFCSSSQPLSTTAPHTEPATASHHQGQHTRRLMPPCSDPQSYALS